MIIFTETGMKSMAQFPGITHLGIDLFLGQGAPASQTKLLGNSTDDPFIAVVMHVPGCSSGRMHVLVVQFPPTIQTMPPLNGLKGKVLIELSRELRPQISSGKLD
jgi:hypothetical protein